MNRQEYMLVCLAEELAECQKEIGKCLRFGINDCAPDDESKITNITKLQIELNHVKAVEGLLFSEWDIPGIDEKRHFRAKQERVYRFMEYSRERNCLQDKE